MDAFEEQPDSAAAPASDLLAGGEPDAAADFLADPNILLADPDADFLAGDPDPAADFLAREQAELGEELGEELGISNGAPPVIADISGLSLEDQQELEAVNQEVAQERTSTPSPAFIMPPRYHSYIT